METYSYSKIERYKRCPLSYKRKYIENVPDLENANTHGGSIAHAYLEKRFKMGHEEAVAEVMKKYPDFESVVQITNDLRPLVTPGFFDHTIDVEHGMVFEIGKNKFYGIIDRLDMEGGVYKIIDYKYGKYEYSKKDLDSSMQLMIYASGVMQNYSVSEVVIAYYNLQQNTLVSKKVSKHDLKDELIISEIDRIVDGIEHSVFPAKPSFQCYYCSVSKGCPFHILHQDEDAIKARINDENDVIAYYHIIQEKERYYHAKRKAIEPYLRDLMDLGYQNLSEDRGGNIVAD